MTLEPHPTNPRAAALALFLLALGGCSGPHTPPPAATTMNEKPTPPPAAAPAGQYETATFGAGCFWCVEAVLDRVAGVHDVASGYMGGTVERPSYEQVCRGDTGHAEVVQVRFDPQAIGYAELLDYFFQLHDPTTADRQGNDVGPQYRSALFCHSPAQEAAARAAIARWQPKFAQPIVTEVTAAGTFWPAEGYHQDYWANNPGNGYCRAFIPPKLKKLGLDGKPRAPQR
jgi:peptide-methionine (S)-S-oxide reductase